MKAIRYKNKECKISKTFNYLNIDIFLIKHEGITRAVNKFGLLIPVNFDHKQTLNSCADRVIRFIDTMQLFKTENEIITELNRMS